MRAERRCGVRVTLQTLGAWVVKCDPRLTDLDAIRSTGSGVVDQWCVADNYRSDLIAADQRVLLWVSGPRGAPIERGFWGSGETTGRVFGGPAPLRPGSKRKLFAPMRLRLLEAPVTATAVAAIPELADIEVVRQPQMSNPSWLTTEQIEILDALLAD
jgi:hypothetical protein